MLTIWLVEHDLKETKVMLVRNDHKVIPEALVLRETNEIKGHNESEINDTKALMEITEHNEIRVHNETNEHPIHTGIEMLVMLR
jgi:hypothetical protein